LKSIENYETEFYKLFATLLTKFLQKSETSIRKEEHIYFTYKKFNLIFEKIKITQKLIDEFKPLFKEYLVKRKIIDMEYKKSIPFIMKYPQFIRFISFNNTILDNF
jgi:hypothetical protein